MTMPQGVFACNMIADDYVEAVVLPTLDGLTTHTLFYGHAAVQNPERFRSMSDGKRCKALSIASRLHQTERTSTNFHAFCVDL